MQHWIKFIWIMVLKNLYITLLLEQAAILEIQIGPRTVFPSLK